MFVFVAIQNGKTALHIAAECGHSSIAQELITAKANIHLKDKVLPSPASHPLFSLLLISSLLSLIPHFLPSHDCLFPFAPSLNPYSHPSIHFLSLHPL